MEISNRVALVTGGAHGIGRALCKALQLEGARVAVADLDFEGARKVASAISGLALKLDVSSEQEIVAAVERVESELGPVDIFISNAGVAFGDGPNGAASAPNEHWRACLDVNLMAHVYAARIMIPRMKERGGGGKLVAISSISEHFGSPKQVHYAAGKAGLGAMVRSLAVELARYDIQVNSILPGWIVTEATAPAQQNEPLNQVVLKRTPARRWGTPEDLEGIAVSLASKASDFHTGDSIRVDGGYSIF